MPKPINELSDQQLTALVNNYEQKGVSEGGQHSLAEVKLEQLRRAPAAFSAAEIAQRIITKASESDDGLVTYGDLWQDLHPGQTWRGNADQQVIANALARVVAYCVDHDLPILTTLVVQKSGRKLSDLAIKNIVEEVRGLGVDTGDDEQAFVERERQRAKDLVSLPDETPRDFAD